MLGDKVDDIQRPSVIIAKQDAKPIATKHGASITLLTFSPVLWGLHIRATHILDTLSQVHYTAAAYEKQAADSFSMTKVATIGARLRIILQLHREYRQ